MRTDSQAVKGKSTVYHSVDEDDLPHEHLDKIADILGCPNVATEPSKMDIPSFHLRALDSEHEGHWGVQVADDLLISFRFEDSDVYDVDLQAQG